MPHRIEGYGQYPILDSYESEFFSITIQKLNNFLLFERVVEASKEKYSTKLGIDASSIIFQPSEPVFREVDTTLILLHFEEPLTMLPNSSLELFTTLPIATSVILSENGKSIPLDLIHLAPVKFTLYGDAHKGKICRYWKTNLSFSPVKTDFLRTCALNLNISNSSAGTIKLTNLVFDFAYLEIIYSNQHCFSKAKVKILSENIAETEFSPPGYIEGFNQSYDLLPTKKFSSPKFLMEFGI
jgi:hypothetical protein